MPLSLLAVFANIPLGPSEEKAAAAAANQDRLLSRRLMFSAFLRCKGFVASRVFFYELGVSVKFVSYGFVDSVEVSGVSGCGLW